MSLSQSPPPAHRRRSSASPSPSTGSVQVVTRKVIRTLEGLGHAIEDVADDEHHEMEDETEVAAALRADKRQGKQRAQPEVKKIDWEIPRKVFHSSIGRWHSLSLNNNVALTVNQCRLHNTGPVPDAEHRPADGDRRAVVSACRNRPDGRRASASPRRRARIRAPARLPYARERAGAHSLFHGIQAKLTAV